MYGNMVIILHKNSGLKLSDIFSFWHLTIEINHMLALYVEMATSE